MRKEQWPEILADEIEAARGRPFAWGSHDCCAFAARVVQAMTGVDFLANFAPYHDKAGANALLSGHDGVRDFATACLGNPIPPLKAQRGDIVVVDTKDGEALGICNGSHHVCASLRGIEVVPFGEALAAWRV